MAILAMSLPAGQAGRRAILALPWLGKPTGKPLGPLTGMPMVLMGETPMLRFHARADMTASADLAESRRAGSPTP